MVSGSGPAPRRRAVCTFCQGDGIKVTGVVFQGASALTLDAKGRLSVPARHRELLQALAETPEEFAGYEKAAYGKGFLMVSASPLTRSSHHAGEDFARLKAAREAQLIAQPGYEAVRGKVETPGLLADLMARTQPEIVVHLAAQAGVRYSIENPRAYVEANLDGSFELLEAARAHPPRHLLMASTSSVYGANTEMPYRETDKVDTQMSFYAATKKANEAMAHSYAHLFGLPVTMFRFFTVYGPWGRPDMAPMIFTRKILAGEPIDVGRRDRRFAVAARHAAQIVGDHHQDVAAHAGTLSGVVPSGDDVRGNSAITSPATATACLRRSCKGMPRASASR